MAWIPQPKQRLALASDSFELFFGGAKGGGKSDFLLADFTRGLRYGSDYKGILFRRSYSELEELIDRSQEIYPDLGGTWLKTEKTWKFNTGSVLKLRFLERDADVHNYQGHQYQWLGFDEITNYPSDYCYTYMIGMVRSAAGVPCYVRSSGNPGSVGHLWVKARFIDPMKPMRKYVDPKTGLTRMFIPARLEDNTALSENDPDYEKRLRMTSDDLYRAYRYGDWEVSIGAMLSMFDREKHLFSYDTKMPESWFKFMAMDWGYKAPFSIGFYAVDPDGRLWRYREWYGSEKGDNQGLEMDARAVAQKLVEMADSYYIIADPACWSRHGHGTNIITYFIEAGFTCIKANNDRKNGLQTFIQRLKTEYEGLPMFMVADTCYNWIRTVPMLQSDPNDPEDVNTKQEDHAYDESRYSVMTSLVHMTRQQQAEVKREDYNVFTY